MGDLKAPLLNTNIKFRAHKLTGEISLDQKAFQTRADVAPLSLEEFVDFSGMLAGCDDKAMSTKLPCFFDAHRTLALGSLVGLKSGQEMRCLLSFKDKPYAKLGFEVNDLRVWPNRKGQTTLEKVEVEINNSKQPLINITATIEYIDDNGLPGYPMQHMLFALPDTDPSIFSCGSPRNDKPSDDTGRIVGKVVAWALATGLELAAFTLAMQQIVRLYAGADKAAAIKALLAAARLFKGLKPGDIVKAFGITFGGVGVFGSGNLALMIASGAFTSERTNRPDYRKVVEEIKASGYTDLTFVARSLKDAIPQDADMPEIGSALATAFGVSYGAMLRAMLEAGYAVNPEDRPRVLQRINSHINPEDAFEQSVATLNPGPNVEAELYAIARGVVQALQVHNAPTLTDCLVCVRPKLQNLGLSLPCMAGKIAEIAYEGKGLDKDGIFGQFGPSLTPGEVGEAITVYFRGNSPSDFLKQLLEKYRRSPEDVGKAMRGIYAGAGIQDGSSMRDGFRRMLANEVRESPNFFNATYIATAYAQNKGLIQVADCQTDLVNRFGISGEVAQRAANEAWSKYQ